MMKNARTNELLNNAWKGGNNCYLINWVSNNIVVVNTKEAYDIPEKDIMNIAIELSEKGIEKCSLDFRVLTFGYGLIIGRKKEFNRYVKKYGLDKMMKPLAEIIKL